MCKVINETQRKMFKFMIKSQEQCSKLIMKPQEQCSKSLMKTQKQCSKAMMKTQERYSKSILKNEEKLVSVFKIFVSLLELLKCFCYFVGLHKQLHEIQLQYRGFPGNVSEIFQGKCFSRRKPVVKGYKGN